MISKEIFNDDFLELWEIPCMMYKTFKNFDKPIAWFRSPSLIIEFEMLTLLSECYAKFKYLIV